MRYADQTRVVKVNRYNLIRIQGLIDFLNLFVVHNSSAVKLVASNGIFLLRILFCSLSKLSAEEVYGSIKRLAHVLAP